MATDYISKESLTNALDSLCDRVCQYSKKQRYVMCGCCPLGQVYDVVDDFEAADVVEIPKSGIGDLSDGYHTFNGLYYQRMVLFAALVKAYKGNAWKSWKHENGEPCFGGGWFIVGIDTPQGSYTYHYEDKYWNWFECEELPVAKHWDGHTEKDVTRLMSLNVVERKHGKWERKLVPIFDEGVIMIPGNVCSECGGITTYNVSLFKYCPNCGARMVDDDV